MAKLQFPNPERVEDLRQIHEAMETCGGNLTEAAKLLGLKRHVLQKALYNCPDLALRWTKSKKLTDAPAIEAVDLNRTDLMIHSDAADIERRMQQEQGAMRAGLEQMGVAGPGLDLAVAMQQFHGRHYTTSLKLIGGGLTKQFLDLMEEAKKITLELEAGGREFPTINLETGEKSGTRFVPLTPMREKVLRDDRASIIEAMQRMSDRANKAILTQAIIKQKLQGKQSNQRPKGFLQIPNAKQVNVLVNTPGAPAMTALEENALSDGERDDP